MENVKYFGFNALDKVLIDTNLENWEAFAQKVVTELKEKTF
jgi:glutamate-5-semialdehyde dehydrogenase